MDLSIYLSIYLSKPLRDLNIYLKKNSLSLSLSLSLALSHTLSLSIYIYIYKTQFYYKQRSGYMDAQHGR